MGITIGQLRSIVQFKINIPEVLGQGFDDSYFDFGQTRGYLKNKGGQRDMMTGSIDRTNEYYLWIRYQPYYARVDLRVVIEGRNFTIQTVEIEDEGRKTYLKFTLSEKK